MKVEIIVKNSGALHRCVESLQGAIERIKSDIHLIENSVEVVEVKNKEGYTEELKQRVIIETEE